MTPDEGPINISSKSNIDKTALKVKEMDLKAGQLGKFFGTEGNAPFNICGLIALVLILNVPIICIFDTKIEPKEYLTSILPIIGTIVGFFFGKKIT